MSPDQLSMADLFGEPIHVYTREQAVEDGFLVELDEVTYGEYGFRAPVVITAALHSLITTVAARKTNICDYRGILHDVLWLGHFVAGAMAKRGDYEAGYKVIIAGRKVLILIAFSPAEGWTFMLPEDR